MSNRTIQHHFFVTPKEDYLIKRHMKQSGIINLSAYLRKMAIDGYVITLDMRDIRELSRTLSNCANNLNQFAKRANETGSIYQADIEDLKERMNEIVQQEKLILQQFTELP